MGFVKIENYDGEKGYIGIDRFEVVERKEIKYLVRLGLIQFNDELIPPSSGLEHEVYRIISENLQTDSAIATEEKRKSVLLDLAKILEREDEEIL